MAISTPLDFPVLQTGVDLEKPEELIAKLEKLARQKSKKGSVKKISNAIKDTNYQIDSWRFNEWDYSSSKVTLPTNARGLFTMGENRIICRGYDKFFSVAEVASTQPAELKADTYGPYYLTVKSNGCIAFISGLEDGTLVVCSKHSTGYRVELSKNHAIAAQTALENQLEINGIDIREFAKMLARLNATAVCEYCDDAFEEHVLEYKGEKSGLYLHGINKNTCEFITYSMEQVDEFATKFGFKHTKYHKLDTYEQTIKFLNETNETGIYQGDEIEGFVIRCKRIHNDFFFKFKFEEPYLLYRELREVTKSYLNTGQLPHIQFGKRKHKLICMDYLKFVVPLFEADPQLSIDFKENKRVIELRKAYFKFKNTSAMEAVSKEESIGALEEDMKQLNMNMTMDEGHKFRYILVTVATIGCGKTTTSIGLQNLYPDLIGHVQNDNIRRPVANKLTAQGLEELVNKPIVILDKNNHKFIERKQVFTDFNALNRLLPRDHVKIICLNFLKDVKPKKDDKFWGLTRDRILNRGDSHQTIKVESEGIGKAEAIMKGFISRFQPIDTKREPDSLFDNVIDLKVGKDSSLKNMKIIDRELRKIAPEVNWPSVDEIKFNEAFQMAKEYKPVIVKNMGKVKIVPPTAPPKKKKPYYFGIRVPYTRVLELIKQEVLTSSIENMSLAESKQSIDKLFNEFESSGRIQEEFHVTLFHKLQCKESDQLKVQWDKICENIQSQGEVNNLDIELKTDLILERLCFNENVICVEVKISEIVDNDGGIVDFPCVNKYPHVTIGTREGFKAVESNKLLNTIYDSNINTGIITLESVKLEKVSLFVHF